MRLLAANSQLSTSSRNFLRVIPAFVFGLMAAAPSVVFGLGVRVPNQDAEAIGRGNAFAATANNPSALYYNPAGITQLPGFQVQVGVLNYLGITSDYKNDTTGASAKTDWQVVPIPQFYATYTPSNYCLSYGLGVYAPFGLHLTWPDNGPFNDLAIEGKIDYISINPEVAWEIDPKLSIAIGPTFNYSTASLRQGIGLTPNDSFAFDGSAWGFGYHAGILWKPCSKISVGANYRNPGSINYQGSSDFSPYLPATATTAKVNFPQIAAGGISYRPTPKWNLEVDVDWTDWSSVDTLVFKGAVNPLTGTDAQLPLNWHASWFYHAGVTRYFENGYFVSIGYFFSQNSTSEVDFTPYVPDTNLNVGSLGVGHKGKHWDWALAGQIIAGPWRTISDSAAVSISGQSANGRYQLTVPAVSASIAYHF
jgi:long-chain fatty acid transport protein